MLHPESLLQSTQGSSCLAKVDMAHAYWQLPLAPESQEMLSIQTPLGVWIDNIPLEMKKPTTNGELQQLLRATNWMRTSLPAYAETISPLHEPMEIAHKKAGERTKKAARDRTVCLFTAADTHWAAILSQVPEQERQKFVEVQSNGPLCFLCGAFKGPSANWSVAEKEGFAIVELICRMDYIASGHVVPTFTAHC